MFRKLRLIINHCKVNENTPYTYVIRLDINIWIFLYNVVNIDQLMSLCQMTTL